MIRKDSDDSERQIQRYIRLTYLIPELLSMVDDNKIAFNPAVEISYLDREEQLTLLDAINMNDCTPSHAQSIRLKKMSQDGLLTADAVYAVLSEEKPNQREQIKLPRDELRKYFPQNYSDEQIKRDMNFLWNSGIVEYNSGPRSFDEISDESFKKIIDESGTKLFKDTSDTQAKIMLSIKPKYVEEIMAGRKKYEYRKRLAGESVKKIYIYETSPISKVVGEVDVEGVLTIPKDQLGEKTKYRSGISFEEYNEYFSCSDIGNAYILGKVTKYETPKSLESFGVSQPPQSFVYVNQS